MNELSGDGPNGAQERMLGRVVEVQGFQALDPEVHGWVRIEPEPLAEPAHARLQEPLLEHEPPETYLLERFRHDLRFSQDDAGFEVCPALQEFPKEEYQPEYQHQV